MYYFCSVTGPHMIKLKRKIISFWGVFASMAWAQFYLIDIADSLCVRDIALCMALSIKMSNVLSGNLYLIKQISKFTDKSNIRPQGKE